MIGKNIKKIREQKGLTLSECAQRANISKSYLSNIERNLNQNPSIHILEKIAEVLEVDIGMLIDMQSESQVLSDPEWIEFIKELKKSGVEKDELQELKKVIEFAKWQNEQKDKD
ncbi:helix-turn-helix transcriptional regulator [Virgibacillus sp. YIM 98842]|jgi:XRE family transcriptional regulator of biofilm formation|uniref:helix-turn-helix domain-containing protein n=1 Tax=Virgibacillus sp. YIM 98842 TaxID=2663533 RepID=UPI0013DC3562|nr:helix-turn-helix transcriptional regulator [Virgibacillus sp. YIM 98842]